MKKTINIIWKIVLVVVITFMLIGAGVVYTKRDEIITSNFTMSYFSETVNNFDEEKAKGFVANSNGDVLYNNFVAVLNNQYFYEGVSDFKFEITDKEMLGNGKYRCLFSNSFEDNVSKCYLENEGRYMNYLIDKQSIYKIGHSYDYHNFKDGEKLILGGIYIEASFGLEGYSDSDVLYHSVCEAILGALGLGDIGKIFPDNAIENFKRNSLDFVNYALDKLDEEGYKINNIDIMIYLQKPNLKNHKQLICDNLKKVLNTPCVNVKATTLEKQGLIGTSKGIGVESVVLLTSRQ